MVGREITLSFSSDRAPLSLCGQARSFKLLKLFVKLSS